MSGKHFGTKRYSNSDVISRWASGDAAKSFNGNLTTNGEFLFSYNLLIGWTNPANKKVVTLYNAPNNGFKSVTTSVHVSYAEQVSDLSEQPIGAEIKKSSVL